MPPRLSKAGVRRCGLPSRATFRKVLSIGMHIMSHECIGQMRTMKYLRENCYHYIEYSVANSLIALMWKWYLNSNFQPYSYSQRLLEGADGTKINTSDLIYTWRVEMKERRWYKIEKRPWGKGIGKWRENTVGTRTGLVTKFKRDISKKWSSWIVPRTIIFG